MKTPRFVALFVASCLSLGWLASLWVGPAAVEKGVTSNVSARQQSGAKKQEVPGSPTLPPAAEVLPDLPAPPPPPPAETASSMSFDGLASAGVEVSREWRRFERQTWEPDLVKAVELESGQPLFRQSVVYRVSDFPYSLIRVDRVYRTDRRTVGVGADVSSPKTSASEKAEGSRHPLQGTAAPGELVWENAMVADHLMVQVETDITQEQLQSALPAGSRVLEPVTREGLYLVAVPAEGGNAVEHSVAALNRLHGIVRFAEPDFVMTGADTEPNDPIYAESPGPQWHLPKVMAPRAWDVIKEPRNATEAASTVVAIVDTGVDYTHPDLAPNIWTNPGEVPGNRIDDDGNGRIDDIRGWNFVENNANPMDDVGHGTHVAGIVGAVGNNAMGGTGLCWSVKLLPLRIIRKLAGGTYGVYSHAVAAMVYIRDLNRDGRQVAVANHSWGGAGFSASMLGAIDNAKITKDPVPLAGSVKSTFPKNTNILQLVGTSAELVKIRSGMTIGGTGIPAGTRVTIVKGERIFLSNFTTVARTNQVLTFINPVMPQPYGMIHVAAAGNKHQDNDRFPTYPACTPSGFVLSVGATDQSDAESIWSQTTGSNFGAQTVDIYAPGTGIWSTKLKLSNEPNYGYESRDGTSMAAPLVAGTAALLTMWQSQVRDHRQIKQIILDNVDVVPGLAGKCATTGRLNVAKILDRLYQPLLADSGGSTGGGGGQTASALSIGLALNGQVAKGDAFTIAIREGRVSSWGWGYYGQTAADAAHGYATAVPVAVPNSEDAVMVTAAGNTGLMLKSNGSVWAWGGNHDGLLASGGTDFLAHPTPTEVSNLWTVETPGPQAVWLAAGGEIGSSHVAAVNADGTVWTWGRNEKGQLGDGSQVDRFTPVQVPGLDEVVMTAVGTSFTLALRQDGTVWQWGRKPGAAANAAPNLAPVQVSGLTGVTYIAAGFATAYAVLDNGAVHWWGAFDGDDTQIGYPGLTETPTLYQELSDIVAIAAGNGFALGVDGLGRVYAWGRNDMGQLGAGLSDPASRPVQIVSLGTEGVGALAAGRDSSIVLLGSGEVAAWGRNQRGELGSGRLDESLLPVQVPGLSEIATARAGRSPAAAARRRDGVWYFWGEATADPDAQLPALFTAFSPMSDLQTCPNHDFVLARKTDGSLWTWGETNTWGEFGNGTVGIAAQPPGPATALKVSNVTGVISFSVSPGLYTLPPGDPLGAFDASIHCLAVNGDGSVRAWGRGHRGQLGDGTTVANRATPVTVTGLTGVVEVAAGGAHSLARRNDGTVWAWGHNTYGQLGDGSTTQRTTPVQVVGLGDVVQIKAARDSNAALKSDGSVWVWGAPSGITSPTGLTGNVTTPQRVSGLPALFRIAVGGDVCMGVDVAGEVWAWSLYPGLLGRRSSSTDDPWTPARVEGLSQIIDLSLGEGNAFAVRADGTLWAWGNSESGFLGDGSAWSTAPVFVLGFGGVSESLSTLGTGDAANSWQLQNFSPEELRDPEIIDDTADPDLDRLANLLEYAVGLDPNIFSTEGVPTAQVDELARSTDTESDGNGSQISLFAVDEDDPEDPEDVEKRYLGLSVPRSGVRPDVEYIVEVSTDLINWRSGDDDIFTITDNADLLVVYSSLSLEDMKAQELASGQTLHQYIRLRVRRTSIGGVSVTGPAFGTDSDGVDVSEVKQVAFKRGSSVAGEADGSASVGVTITPAPTATVTLPLTFGGTAANGAGKDYTVASTSVSFAADQSEVEIPITLLQDALPEAVKTIIISLNKPAGSVALGQPATHVVTLLDDESKPRALVQPVSRFVARGAPVQLISGFVGSPTPSLQWFKDGGQVGGAKTNTLNLAKADLSNGGEYSLRATNLLGTVFSEVARLGVVDTTARTLSFAPGATTTLKVDAGGKKLTFEWQKDGVALTEGAPFSGVQTAVLKITGLSVSDSGAYKCVVRMGPLAMDGGVTTLRVIDQPPEIIEPVVLPDVVIGALYGPVAVPVDPLVRRSVTKYTATGLPPGLKLDGNTGLISGRATARKTTAYPVTLKVSNGVSSDTATTTLFVRELAPEVDGVYTGFVERNAQVNGDLGGRLDVTVTSAGGFSGKLINGTVAHSFSGLFLDSALDSPAPTATVTIIRKGLPSLLLKFTLLSGEHRMADASVSIGNQTAVITAWRQRWNAKGPTADLYKGYYTVALPAPAGPVTQPQGAGFASFTILPAGTLTVAGKLADGVSFTTGTFVGPRGEVLVHQASATTDTIVGSLSITAGTPPLFADSTVTGSVTWSRKVQGASQPIYRNGFAALLVQPFGARYVEPAATAVPMGLPDQAGNARLVFTGGDFGVPAVAPDITVRIQPKGVVIMPLAADNPRKSTLTLTTKSGSIKGGMTFKDGSVSRTSSYEGIIVTEPGGVQRGYGFFLLGKLPVPVPTVTESGLVVLEAKP